MNYSQLAAATAHNKEKFIDVNCSFRFMQFDCD